MKKTLGENVEGFSLSVNFAFVLCRRHSTLGSSTFILHLLCDESTKQTQP